MRFLNYQWDMSDMVNKEKQSKLDQQNNLDNFKDSITNYADRIESIDSFVEAVRKLPGMYIGAIGNVGWLACIREIFQNSIDECIKTDSPCHYIRITFDERNQSALIEDCGRGIPHNHIIRIFTSEHTSSNYTKNPGEYSSGVHGVGGGVALSLSKKFIICSYVLGKAKEVQFIDGIPWKDEEKNIPCPAGRQGSSMYMEPAIEVLGHVNLTCQEVFDLVFKIFPLTNIGDQIDFIGIDKGGNQCIYEELVNKDGVITNLMLKTQTPLVVPIMFKDDSGYMKAEIAFTYDSSDINSSEDITSYSNFTPTLSGTHVTGFMDGLCNFFRNYINKIYLGEKSKISVVNSDIKTGLKATIVAAHLNPIFIGQSKAILSNEDMGVFVKDLTTKSLEQWSKTNPADLQKACKYIKEIAEIRMKSDDSKINLSKKYNTNLLTGKPKKYVQPSGNKDLELWIMEGDSALGSAKNSRDFTKQGLFPIRGKLPNAFDTTKASFLANEEVASIITIIGGGYGKNFDISKVKWQKIVLGADADPDGSHIKTLLLRFFLLYMPELIIDGRLYGAVPPLFGVKTNKGMKYFVNKIDFTRYIQNLFSKSYVVSSMSGNKLSNNEMTALFMTNVDYTYELEIISHTFAIDPFLLESILYQYSSSISFESAVEKKFGGENDIINNFLNRNSETNKMEIEVMKMSDNPIKINAPFSIDTKFNYNTFKSTIEKQYRFIKVGKNNGVITVEGLVNNKYHYIYMNDKFISSCKRIFDIIHSNSQLMYRLNNEPNTLYQLMKTFENSTPNGLTRYKGLGEQNPNQLGESVLRPDSDRTLVQYKIEDIKQEIELIRYVDSNKDMLLKDIKITRQDIE